MSTKPEKILFTGKTQTTPASRDASGGSDHGKLDIYLSSPGVEGPVFESTVPHPTAEQLFAGAWSACYSAAIGLVAMQKKVKLPSDLSVGIEVDLVQAGAEFFLRARFDVALPGLEQSIAETLVHDAHQVCPYSKATRGNIEVATNVRT